MFSAYESGNCLVLVSRERSGVSGAWTRQGLAGRTSLRQGALRTAT